MSDASFSAWAAKENERERAHERGRKVLRETVTPREKPLFGGCQFCGFPCVGAACPACRPALDELIAYQEGVTEA